MTAKLSDGVLVQMTAQVAEAKPSPAGWLVAAMPALGFLAVVKLLMRRAPEPEPASTPVPAPVATEDVPALPRVLLPADITARINAAVAAARDEGREPSIEDIQRVARVPADLARRVLADQPANGHRLPALD